MPDGRLNTVAAASAHDAWAAGSAHGTRCLALHWDGTAWTAVVTPHLPGFGIVSLAITAGGAAWAVGQSYPPARGLTLRWR